MSGTYGEMLFEGLTRQVLCGGGKQDWERDRNGSLVLLGHVNSDDLPLVFKSLPVPPGDSGSGRER